MICQKLGPLGLNKLPDFRLFAPVICNISHCAPPAGYYNEKTSDISLYNSVFSVYCKIKRNSIEFGVFAQFLAKLLLNIVIFH